MLSQIQGASLNTLGTMNQTTNTALNSSRSSARGPRSRHSHTAVPMAMGMNSPVLAIQNQIGFESPRSQPSSKPKKVPVFETLPLDDHQIAGRARSSVTTT